MASPRLVLIVGFLAAMFTLSLAGVVPAGPELTSPMFNCLTKEVWVPEKREWCCVHRGLGCSTNANSTSITNNNLDPNSDLDIEDGSGSDSVLRGVIAPSWTRGEIEPPAGERTNASGTLAVYTSEQQRRLGVNEWGEPTVDAAPDAAPGKTSQAAPSTNENRTDLVFDGDGWHSARCFCYNGSAVTSPIRGGGGHGHHHHSHSMACAEDSELICETSIHFALAMVFVLSLIVILITICCQRFCCRKNCGRLLGFGGVAAASSKSIPSYFYLDSDTDLNSPVAYTKDDSAGKFKLHENQSLQSKV